MTRDKWSTRPWAALLVALLAWALGASAVVTGPFGDTSGNTANPLFTGIQTGPITSLLFYQTCCNLKCLVPKIAVGFNGIVAESNPSTGVASPPPPTFTLAANEFISKATVTVGTSAGLVGAFFGELSVTTNTNRVYQVGPPSRGACGGINYQQTVDATPVGGLWKLTKINGSHVSGPGGNLINTLLFEWEPVVLPSPPPSPPPPSPPPPSPTCETAYTGDAMLRGLCNNCLANGVPADKRFCTGNGVPKCQSPSCFNCLSNGNPADKATCSSCDSAYPAGPSRDQCFNCLANGTPSDKSFCIGKCTSQNCWNCLANGSPTDKSTCATLNK